MRIPGTERSADAELAFVSGHGMDSPAPDLPIFDDAIHSGPKLHHLSSRGLRKDRTGMLGRVIVESRK